MEAINCTKMFIELINKNSIQYTVLRNYQSLPETTGGSDLDILIHKDSVDLFNILFRDFIKSNKLKLVSVIKDKQCPKYCIIGKNWGLQIDVFKGSVHFGKKELIPSSILFKYTLDYKGVRALNPELGAVLAFLKELLNNKICSEKYIIDLQHQFHDYKIEPYIFSQFKNEFQLYLNQNLHQLDETHCLELYQISKKSFRSSKFSGFKNKIKRFLKQPGYSIAFLGTDGSGKSTIIENIKPALNDTFHNAVYYEHMRPNKFPSIAKLLGNKEEFTGPVTNPHGSSASGFLGSFLRWFYYMLDYTFGFYLKVWPKKAIRSCVWLFDRYYYDYLIDPKRGRIKLPNWILKFGQFIIPEPDIILCLGADPAAIHQRKPELPLKEVERQVTALKKFCNSHKRAVWIDTGKNIDESSNDALEAIIEMMSKRFESVKLTE